MYVINYFPFGFDYVYFPFVFYYYFPFVFDYYFPFGLDYVYFPFGLDYVYFPRKRKPEVIFKRVTKRYGNAVEIIKDMDRLLTEDLV